MIATLWQKEIVIKVQLIYEDVSDWIPPLPLYLGVRWNHYIGMYLPLIYDFFFPFLPFPHNQETMTLKMPSHDLALTGTQIVSHLYTLYAQENKTTLTLECQLRQAQTIPSVDLKRFFKQNLKASTCIRYGKFGSKAITVDMSVHNIEDMYRNFSENKLTDYLGEVQEESTKLGYRFIVQNAQKIESVPVRILGKDYIIQRSVPKTSTLRQLWEQIAGDLQGLRLHGVKLKRLDIPMQRLEQYCHPDGFLYFTF